MDGEAKNPLRMIGILLVEPQAAAVRMLAGFCVPDFSRTEFVQRTRHTGPPFGPPPIYSIGWGVVEQVETLSSLFFMGALLFWGQADPSRYSCRMPPPGTTLFQNEVQQVSVK